jgi:hypothetical protein
MEEVVHGFEVVGVAILVTGSLIALGGYVLALLRGGVPGPTKGPAGIGARSSWDWRSSSSPTSFSPSPSRRRWRARSRLG